LFKQRRTISQPQFFNHPQSAFHSSKSLYKEITVRESIGMAMSEEIERDSKVFLIGEEVGQY